MSISRKGKRKIVCNGKEYLWHIREDRFGDGYFMSEYGTLLSLSIVAADRSFFLCVPVNPTQPYFLENRRIDVPKAITPRFVAEVVSLCSEKKEYAFSKS